MLMVVRFNSFLSYFYPADKTCQTWLPDISCRICEQGGSRWLRAVTRLD